MYSVNENYLKLPGSYLFSTVGMKTREYKASHPEAEVVSLGIGDVTQPLVPAVISALHAAVDEMAHRETFHGYSPDQGYAFLRETIARDDYVSFGCDISSEEIFISDGAKSDAGNIQEIFAIDNTIAVCDPVYPVYVDSNAMAGRCGDYDPKKMRWSGVIYMPCTADNGFLPQIPEERPDIIYLCFPNNPTGMAVTKSVLQDWVDYANKIGAVIIYDAAYEAYINDARRRNDTVENISEKDAVKSAEKDSEGRKSIARQTLASSPHSIYECDGARTCAIEIRSFSKNAGFTGVRLGFTVVPTDLQSGGVSLHSLWARRHGTKFNGAPYIVQRAAMAVYSKEGKAQLREQIGYYMRNAHIIRTGLEDAGYTVYGGIDAPYIWMKTPGRMTSWEFFDYLLSRANVVGTPGSGFGPSGEGYFRLTAFGTWEDTKKAMERIRLI